MQGGPHESEERKTSRTAVRLKVCLTMSREGEMLAVTRDISDGGLFVLLDAEKIPGVGGGKWTSRYRGSLMAWKRRG